MYHQVQVFWYVMPCNVAVGYQIFGGPYFLHLQGKIFKQGLQEGLALNLHQRKNLKSRM